MHENIENVYGCTKIPQNRRDPQYTISCLTHNILDGYSDY